MCSITTQIQHKVNTHDPNVNLNDTQMKHSQTHGKYTMRSTSTKKIILCWTTIFRAQVKHAVALREHQFDGVNLYIPFCPGESAIYADRST